MALPIVDRIRSINNEAGHRFSDPENLKSVTLLDLETKY